MRRWSSLLPRAHQRQWPLRPVMASMVKPAPRFLSSSTTTEEDQQPILDPPEGTVLLHNTAVTSPSPKALGWPPLVILHGLFGAGINWRTVAKKLTSSCQLNSLLIDLRNHGSSPHHPDHSYDAMVGDLHHLLAQRYRMSTFSLMGHSMGGNLAMRTALKYPDMIDRLIVVDFAPVTYHEASDSFKNYIELMQSVDLSSIKTRSEVDKYMASTIDEPLLRAFLVSNLVQDAEKKWKWRINLEALKNYVQTIRSWDIEPSAELKYNGPTLFVGGAKSSFIRPEHHKTIQSFFPKAVVETIPDAAHWVHFDKPQEFCRVVEAFLQKTTKK